MSALNPLLAFAAGALTILSPCVLPLVPIVLGGALQKGRWGPLALSLGLILSFTSVGMIAATVGLSAGFDSDWFARIGAAMLIAAGLVLLVPAAQRWLTISMAPLANWASQQQHGLDRFGLAGQAGIGVLLGLVWSPCVGPTLGAATVLAAQGHNLGAAAITFLAFGVGIATVLLFIALTTRTLFARLRGGMMAAGNGGKRVLGVLLVGTGLLIFSGWDHIVEGLLIQASPQWLTDLTTSI